MKNNSLKAAVILGTAALLWSIPSLNIFGITGDIFSWAAYSGGKKGTARAASAMYIIALIVSLITAAALIMSLDLINLGNPDMSGLSSLIRGAAAASFAGDGLYIAAAVTTVKGSKDLKGGSDFYE